MTTKPAEPSRIKLKPRSSNFELLRILAMFIILANHFAFLPYINYPGIKGIDT